MNDYVNVTNWRAKTKRCITYEELRYDLENKEDEILSLKRVKDLRFDHEKKKIVAFYEVFIAMKNGDTYDFEIKKSSPQTVLAIPRTAQQTLTLDNFWQNAKN